jgi:hypothetical protein
MNSGRTHISRNGGRYVPDSLGQRRPEGVGARELGRSVRSVGVEGCGRKGGADCRSLDEQKAQLCQQARAIVHGKAAQIQREDLQFALWAAQGVIVGLLAGGSAKRTDLRLLCKPFAQLLRETPIPAPGENTYCETHPRVPLTYGGCHVCRRGDDKRHSR